MKAYWLPGTGSTIPPLIGAKPISKQRSVPISADKTADNDIIRCSFFKKSNWRKGGVQSVNGCFPGHQFRPKYRATEKTSCVDVEFGRDLIIGLLTPHFLRNSNDTLLPSDLEECQQCLEFPQEVATTLTETEYRLFQKLCPIEFVYEITAKINQWGVENSEENKTAVTELMHRFVKVGSWVTNTVLEAPTPQSKINVLTNFVQIAIACWEMGNFMGVAEILAGLRMDWLKPLWMQVPQYEVGTINNLREAMRCDCPVYRQAVAKAMSTPGCKVVPYFGWFLGELHHVLNDSVSTTIICISNSNRVEAVVNYEGEDNFFSRIGKDGLKDEEKTSAVRWILHDIITCQESYSTIKRHTSSTDLTNSTDYSANYEPGSLLGTESFLDLDSFSRQRLYCGTKVIHCDDSTRFAACHLKLEIHQTLLTWTQSNRTTPKKRNEKDSNVSNGPLPAQQQKTEIVSEGLEEGYLNLASAKDVHFGGKLDVDLSAIVRRFSFYELSENCEKDNVLTVVYGTAASDNRTLRLLMPKRTAQLWYRGLKAIISAMEKQQRCCPDKRILWLQKQYSHLCIQKNTIDGLGPTPAEAVRVFGGKNSAMNSTKPFSSRNGTVKWNGAKSSKRRQTVPSTAKLQSSEHDDSTTNKMEKLAWITEENGCFIGSGGRQRKYTNFNWYFIQTGQRPTKQTKQKTPSQLPLGTHTVLKFSEFIEIFRLFSLRSRKDLKDIFDTYSVCPALRRKSNQNASKRSRVSKLGDYKLFLQESLTLVTSLDSSFDEKDHKVLDAIAAASIPTNCTGVDTSTQTNTVLTVGQFQEFLLKEQEIDLKEKDIVEIIRKYEPNEQLNEENCLSFEGFARYMMSKENFCFVNEDAVTSEDMNHPLSHYYIDCSHNTYLTSHQLRGESSAEMYSQALLAGCRCIELDCWDGDDGWPCIYHGHTLTTKITFREAVEAINRTAFVNSEYPVILSIENHCTIQQQKKMAEMFEEILGEKLLKDLLPDSVENPHLPSPERLKGKILIKNKKLIAQQTLSTNLLRQKVRQVIIAQRAFRLSSSNSPPTPQIQHAPSVSSLSDEYDEEEYDEEETVSYDDYLKSLPDGTTHFSPLTENTQQDADSPALMTKKQDNRRSMPCDYYKSNSANSTLRRSNKKREGVHSVYSEDIFFSPKISKKEPLIAKELSDLVTYTQAVKFPGFSSDRNHKDKEKFSWKPTGNSGRAQATNTHHSSSTSALQSSSTTIPESESTLITLEQSEVNNSSNDHSSVLILQKKFQVSSVNESSLKKKFSKHGTKFIEHTETQLLRTYPSGTRIDSSNYNPIIFWAFGLQLAAMNYQTEDANLHLNSAMFEKTRRCGYVLKPKILRDRNDPLFAQLNPLEKQPVVESTETKPLMLTITIISGQYVCPQNFGGNPSIVVDIIGIPADCARGKTKVIQRNGVNPIWNEDFNFQVLFSELAFLRLTVVDGTGSNTSIGQRIIPLKSVKPGYSHVRLRNMQNKPLEISTLCIRTRTVEIPAKVVAVFRDYKVQLDREKRPEPGMWRATEGEGEDQTFLVCVWNVSKDHPYTVFRAPTSSTSQDIIVKAMNKARKYSEDPRNFILIEATSISNSLDTKKRKTIERHLHDDENVFQVQQSWKSRDCKFMLNHRQQEKKTSKFSLLGTWKNRFSSHHHSTTSQPPKKASSDSEKRSMTLPHNFALNWTNSSMETHQEAPKTKNMKGKTHSFLKKWKSTNN